MRDDGQARRLTSASHACLGILFAASMNRFRCHAQEAIINAVRHGEAGEIDIMLEYSGSSVSLSVADNGRGFVVDNRTPTPAGHWGLENMRPHAAELGGRFGITSGPGSGTVIRATVPL